MRSEKWWVTEGPWTWWRVVNTRGSQGGCTDLEKSSFEDKELNQGQGGCRKINEETTHTLGKEMIEAWRWWW